MIKVCYMVALRNIYCIIFGRMVTLNFHLSKTRNGFEQEKEKMFWNHYVFLFTYIFLCMYFYLKQLFALAFTTFNVLLCFGFSVVIFGVSTNFHYFYRMFFFPSDTKKVIKKKTT